MDRVFCNELLKLALDVEDKARLKNEAKLIGSAALGAGIGHGAWTLLGNALSKKYGPNWRPKLTQGVPKGVLPAVLGLGLYAAQKGAQHAKQRRRDEAQQQWEERTGRPAKQEWRQADFPEISE
jgi:hypothetical protein